MAAPQAIKKPNFQDPEPNPPVLQNPPSKFYKNIFFPKSFTVILVLVLLPLFPSQAPPDFINPTIFPKLWELVYLSFIGIAVSYGLFSRKHEEKSEHESSSDTTFAKRYFSWISQISFIFEDGFENSCGFDEKRVLQGQDLDPSFGLGKIGDFVFGEGCKSSKSCIYKYVFKNPFCSCSEEKKLVENCGPCLHFHIRSSRKSINLDRYSPLSRNVNGFPGSSFEGFSDEGENMRNVNGLVPVNLEQKFKEAEENDHGSPSCTKSERSSVTKWSFFDSFSAEVENPEAEDSMGKVDNSPLKQGNTSLEMFKENLNGLGRSTELGREKQAMDRLNSSPKASFYVNASDRGRSGKRIRSKERYVEEKERGKVGMKIEKVGKGARVKNKIMSLGTRKGNEQGCDSFSDAEPHSGEVDRKADEFIAKFREQIRLQNRVPFRRLNI